MNDMQTGNEELQFADGRTAGGFGIKNISAEGFLSESEGHR